MPNQLAIPFKQSYEAPVKQAVRDYIHSRTDFHPDVFKWDINRWESLREEGRGGIAHVDKIKPSIIYHAQLVFISTKLPTDINLEIAYAPVFSPAALPITLRNLNFERAAVIFNLGALYSQLASSEDRSNQEGLKRAIGHYQSAAGTFNFLISSTLSKLEFVPEDMPLDLTDSFVKSLELLMLAQAQECVWQKAVIDHLKNGLIAKLAGKVASLYGESATTIRQASSSIKHAFPSNWLPHLDAKQCHFTAAAQYRKSIDELEANKYGIEISRLLQAQLEAKKAYDIARRGGVAVVVLQDIESLLDNVQKNIARAERDNDLIYHQDVPAASALAAIPEAAVAQIVVPPALKNPQSAIGSDGVIFSELPSWGAGEAISIYNDNKKILIREKITDAAQELDDVAIRTLRSFNLPSSLEALERPIGLPPSLLKKAEEVRLEEGPARIEESIENIEKLAERNAKLLDEAMDILDNEASEDEAARSSKPLTRPPSHVANQELTSKGERYRRILAEAKDSDEHVRQKWDEWEINIRELTWDEADLEVLVPSSTVSVTGYSIPGAEVTQTHARALRVLLESLDDILHARVQYVDRAERLADADDIGPRILKVAAGFERWTDVKPAMFSDVSDEELAKYDKFIQGINEGRGKQDKLLEEIKTRNQLFLQSRKEDSSVKDREHALQSLDLAYHKYREITRNLDEGLNFYNDLVAILSQFKEACKIWTNGRKQELHSLPQLLQSVSLADTDEKVPASQTDDTAPQPLMVTSASVRQQPFKSPTKGLPSLHSAEWETEDLPPPPKSTKRR